MAAASIVTLATVAASPAGGAPAPGTRGPPARVELHVTTCATGLAAAHFVGRPPGDGFPPEYGVERLWFSFARDPRRHAYRPAGELFFSDWRFDVFSPDCRWTLLLVDRFGPYHLVAVARLRRYLRGAAAPDAVVQVRDGEVAPVHAGARWLSSTEFEFFAGGDPPLRVVRRVPAPRPSRSPRMRRAARPSARPQR